MIAMTQTDLKRVLAYSTISQLGYMFLGLGVGTLAAITAGMFHLFTHAFFKGLLFLGAGSVMHAMGGVVDMRRFGGLRRLMPTTHWTFLFGCLALAGVAPFAGFWSKDLILAPCTTRRAPQLVQSALLDRTGHRVPDVALYLPRVLSHLLRSRARAVRGRQPRPRVAAFDDDAAGDSGDLFARGWRYFELTGSFAALLHTTPSLAYSVIKPPLEVHHEGSSHLAMAAIGTVVALSGLMIAAFLYLGDRSQVMLLRHVLRRSIGFPAASCSSIRSTTPCSCFRWCSSRG